MGAVRTERNTEKNPSVAVPNYAPVDLSTVPAVDEFLRKIGLGPFDRSELKAPTGRNDVWAGPTQDGAKVLVKRITGTEADARARLDRSVSFESFSSKRLSGTVRAPVFLGVDKEACLVAFELLHDARSGAELMVDEEFDEDLAYEAGTMIGQLHNGVPGDTDTLQEIPPLLPSPELFIGIPAAMFGKLSFGELEAWRLLQQDARLGSAVTELVGSETEQRRVPAHCDLRMDQFLIAEERLYLSDWEEFRLADPARDVGAFAGEWLYRSVLDIVTTRGGLPDIDTRLTHEEVLERGVNNLERLRGRIQRFWAGYRHARPAADSALAERATAFAGWHLLERLIAGAGRSTRLSGIEKAAAGIGRAALLAPARFTATIGLEESL